MNPKIRKAARDIERAERKAAEIAAELKQLKTAKAKLEDEEVAKRVRAVASRSRRSIDDVLAGIESGIEPRGKAHEVPGSGESEVG